MRRSLHKFGIICMSILMLSTSIYIYIYINTGNLVQSNFLSVYPYYTSRTVTQKYISRSDIFNILDALSRAPLFIENYSQILSVIVSRRFYISGIILPTARFDISIEKFIASATNEIRKLNLTIRVKALKRVCPLIVVLQQYAPVRHWFCLSDRCCRKWYFCSMRRIDLLSDSSTRIIRFEGKFVQWHTKFEVRRGSIVDKVRHNDFESTYVHACTRGYAYWPLVCVEPIQVWLLVDPLPYDSPVRLDESENTEI